MDASPDTRRTGRRNAVALLSGVLIVGAAGVGWAFVAPSGGGAVYRACLAHGSLQGVTTGDLRKCDDRGQAVSWNQTGPQGPAGISGYQIVADIRPAFPNFTRLTVTCPPGKKAISGGAEALGVNSVLNASLPTAGGNGWIAVGHQPGYASVGLHVFAICATVMP